MIRVGYLNTRYPAISHTFIEREIRALRARGVEVHTFSIRKPAANDRLGPRHEEAAQTTTYILEARRLVRGLLRSGVTRPWAVLRTFVAAQRLSPPGLRARLLHVVYALESLALALGLRRRGLRHCHVHMANNGAAVALLATVFDRSLTYSLTIHGSAEFFDVKGCSLTQKIERAIFVRCISSFCRAQVMAWSDPAVWSRLHVVHCGIDPSEFRSAGPPDEGGALRILTVGRLDPIKGYDLLLEACARLVSAGTDLRLRMVGDGPQRLHLESKVRALELGDRVDLVGAVGQDGLQPHYEWAQVMVVSSFMEGIPVVLMEAMAKERAVIATGVAGIPELIDGTDGVLAVPGSVDDLCRRLATVAGDRALRQSMGERARARIEREYSIDDVGASMAELFARYIAQERDPVGATSPVPTRVGVP